MDIFDMLNANKTKLYEASLDVRKMISSIIDDNSFVELNAFSFGKNEFFEEDLEGLGVVTGYARIDDYPVYIVAQNSKILNGSLSKVNCEKINNCLIKAGESNVPVIYLLDSRGVQVGEGVGVMEGIAQVLSTATNLKDVVTQFAVVVGDVYGSLSLLTAICDYTILVGQSVVSYTSPQVISASANGIDKSVVGGDKAENGVATFVAKDINEVKGYIGKIYSVLPQFTSSIEDTTDDLNRNALILNSKMDAQTLISALFDKGTFIELNSGYAKEVITGIGRVGGVSVASVIFDGGEEGVSLNLASVLKIKNFVNYVSDNGMPMVNLINTKGIKEDFATAKSLVLTEFSNMLYALNNVDIVSVVYGKAIGLGYSAFVSKQFGVKYSYAFCDSKISLLDGDLGVACEFNVIDPQKIKELKADYAKRQDAMNSAKLGCVDNIIEPQYLRQHVISVLQMIIRN